jgi:hypothetical protein
VEWLRRPVGALAATLIVAISALSAATAAGAVTSSQAAAPAALPPAASPVSAAPTPVGDATPLPNPALTLQAAPTSLVSGAACALTASLGVAGASLELSAQPTGQSGWVVLADVAAGSDGSATFAENPTANTTYRVDFAGDANWSAASAQVTVTVAPRITLKLPKSVFGWRAVTATVSVSPAHPGGVVVLQRQFNGKWMAWRTITLGSTSTGKVTWKATHVGRTAFRATMAADADHAAGASGAAIVAVRFPNAYRVPVEPAHFIVVDKSQFMLYYMEHGWVVRAIKCVLGKPSSPTPLGHFRIYAKDPHMWGPYGPRRMRYLGLFAIHGTDQPGLLNRFPRNYSHGCTRLANRDIIWLYGRVPVGTAVWNVP